MTFKIIHLLQVLSKCDIYLHYAKVGKIIIDTELEIISWSFGIGSASCILDICSVHSCHAHASSCVMPESSLSNVLVVYEDDLSTGLESHKFYVTLHAFSWVAFSQVCRRTKEEE